MYYVVFIDKNINQENYQNFKSELESKINQKKYSNIETYSNIEETIKYIKTIKFRETKIIINGNIYSKFMERLKEELNSIFIIPQIIIYTENKEKFLEDNNNNLSDINDPFYKCKIMTTFDDIIKNISEEIGVEQNEKKNKSSNDIPELTFEYIDQKEKLALPLFYKTLIQFTDINTQKYTEKLYNEYSQKIPEIEELFRQIKSIPDVPIQILSKYYIRAYTFPSDFYVDMNSSLRKNEKEKFLPFIKVLYESLKFKSIELSKDKLFRGSKIKNSEIKKIKEYLKSKIENIPSSIVFSRTFLSFSKSKKEALKFTSFIGNTNVIDDNDDEDENEEDNNDENDGDNNNENEEDNNIENNDNNLSEVLYILKKDKNQKIDYDLANHADIENISALSYEKEELFFPFAPFEVKAI